MKPSRLKLIWCLLAGVLSATDLSAQSDTASMFKQFLFPKFSNAVVRFKDGSTQTAQMNYNILSEKMVYRLNGNILDLIKTETVDTVYLQNKKFIPSGNFFLELGLASGIPLYLEHRGNLVMPGKPTAYGGTSQTSAITSVPTLYSGGNAYNLKLPSDYNVSRLTIGWTKVDGVMQKFMTGRQFLKIFKNKEPELRNYIKVNRINFNDPDDLIRLFTFCNAN